jgi:ATP-dependent exoDNAse (exonuclease V) beta subunit
LVKAAAATILFIVSAATLTAQIPIYQMLGLQGSYDDAKRIRQEKQNTNQFVFARLIYNGRIPGYLKNWYTDYPEGDQHLIWALNRLTHLNVAEQNEILEATFNVLDDPAFAHVFSSNGRAEVPLTGLLPRADGHNIVSGQIDRLVVDESGVTVLDYKTNRPAPRDLADVPEAYIRQMRTYRDLLARIWPEKPVRCALVWTDGPALMDVTEAL